MKKESLPKQTNRSGWIMLCITVILYAITTFVNPTVSSNALIKSFDILKMIIPILLIVFFLLALVTALIKPKSIAKHLGEDSGLKGWFFALIGGVISHGSGYIWYPILNELRNNGARSGLIVAFFYARAIKLPWLPVMIGYFGITFTLVLSFYILLGAWIQGIIADKIIGKDI